MNDIAIYGAGGLGREVAAMINRINQFNPQWNLIGFFDDGKKLGEEIGNYGRCLGGINELNGREQPLNVVLAFGNPSTIFAVRSKITNDLISFPNIIGENVTVADSNLQIGEGNIICPSCFFSTDNKIGSFNLFNGWVATGHDVEIGDFNVIMSASKIAGSVTIGNRNLIGSGAFIVQQLKIGDDVKLSPLSALLTKPKNGQTYIGNPAKKFEF